MLSLYLKLTDFIFFYFHVVCVSPDRPVNGNVDSDGYLATYTCDTGYTLYGEYMRVCNNDSTGWNGTAPTCGMLIVEFAY